MTDVIDGEYLIVVASWLQRGDYAGEDVNGSFCLYCLHFEVEALLQWASVRIDSVSKIDWYFKINDVMMKPQISLFDVKYDVVDATN